MSKINSIEISQFRGIKQLEISDFSRINLIAGDNNCGKTTFLEAIQFLFAEANLSSVKSIVRQRTVLNPNDSFYVSFINLFNSEQKGKWLTFEISAAGNDGPIRFEITGNEKTVSGEEAFRISSMSSRQKNAYKKSSPLLPETAKIFTGNVISQNSKKPKDKEITISSIDNVLPGITIKKVIQYAPSFGHLRYDLLQNIVENPEYKKLAVSVLQQFDTSIVDICYTKADDGAFLETIITVDGTNMPFSVYGDGIKKILYILNKLFDSTDSILLIDEIETGLHKKYFERLFPVVFELAKKLNVQLFIATHSLEAIDAILSYAQYDNTSKNNDPIKVITLKRVESPDGKGSNVVARNVTGRYVYENRRAFEFEVRL